MELIMVLYLNTGIIMAQNLFFSEYAEGSSNNKYLEIYNGGSETINLNIYQLVNCIHFSGMLQKIIVVFILSEFQKIKNDPT